jgi:hypothetical protein
MRSQNFIVFFLKGNLWGVYPVCIGAMQMIQFDFLKVKIEVGLQ